MSGHWMNLLADARKEFEDGRFEAALERLEAYRKARDPFALDHEDRRQADAPRVSVVIVSHASGPGLLGCLDSLEDQLGRDAEIILADNGGNEDIRSDLAAFPLLHVRLPLNAGPSEARNIGAEFARGDILLFLDDDGRAGPGLIKNVIEAFDRFGFPAIRGRVLPLTASADNTFPGHYDLGPYPLPSVLDTEGICAVRARAWADVGGMDPLMFGAEGVELTRRLLNAHPREDIYYWPSMVLFHDFASGPGLTAKKKRHETAARYLEFKKSGAATLSREYGLWYQRHPAGTVFIDQRSVFQRLRALWRETRIRFGLKKNPAPAPYPPAPKPRDAESARVAELTAELDALRGSTAYGIGALLSEAAASPLRKGPLLPFRLAARLMAHHRRERGKPVAEDRNRRGPGHIFPLKEEHRCLDFPPAPVFRKSPRSCPGSSPAPGPASGPPPGPRMGFVGNPTLMRFLDLETECVPLSLRHAGLGPKDRAPEMVVVSADTRLAGHGAHRLDALARECRKKGIPLVFWHTGDASHLPVFRETLARCDRAYAPDQAGLEILGTLLPKSACGILPPAIQPAIHNPVRQGAARLAPPQSVLYDGWADLLEFSGELSPLLAPLMDLNLHVVESRWRLRANKLADLPGWRSHVLGCLDPARLPTALKRHALCLFPSPSLAGIADRARRAMEALCCGAAVAADFDPADILGESLPEGAVARARRTTFAGAVRELLQNETERLRAVHTARRILFQRHTYGHRLDAVCRDLSMGHDIVRPPMASIVVPTKRPELAGRVVERFQAQTYAHKELILVVNRENADREQLKALVQGHSDVTLIFAHQENNIGACLNLGAGAARGELVLKMDDDDVYGQNYVLDMVLASLATDADVFGKTPGYVYFENGDELRLRAEGRYGNYLADGSWPHLSGATICARRDVLGRFPFSEDMRHNVDSRFFQQALENGLRVHVADPFNIVVHRSADASGHTWRARDEKLKAESDPVSRGQNFDTALF